MDELIKVDVDTQTVSARELHERLHIKTEFKDWFPRMCDYGFEEGVDFCSKLSETSQRAGCSLNTRLRNMRKRLSDNGATKTQINKCCKVDVIESDKKLREIFSKIVTEYEIKFCA